ncbi:MAG TPA: hypothetical protein VGQ56_11545 [Gemmatimonadaceae bacterium]|nr:hypothetical protein [Gemmatimonadaceae bacterium]
MKRIEELFRLFSEHKSRRDDSVYDGLLAWLVNAEHEYDRRPFAGIAASQNPRGHQAVLLADQLVAANSRWACDPGTPTQRTPEALAKALSAMLLNCKVLHLVDPHFGPENSRHRRVLEALTNVLTARGRAPDVVRVHCAAKSTLSFFEQAARAMANNIPTGIAVEFTRWTERGGGEKLHNRYVLTDLGGVFLGVGLDAGEAGETDDLVLLPRRVFERRWAQYVVNDGSLQMADTPATVHGTRISRNRRQRRTQAMGVSLVVLLTCVNCRSRLTSSKHLF